MNADPVKDSYSALSDAFTSALALALDTAVEAYAQSELWAAHAEEWRDTLAEQLRSARGRLALDGTGSTRLWVSRDCPPLPLVATETSGIEHELPVRVLFPGADTTVEAVGRVLVSPDGYLDAWVVTAGPDGEADARLSFEDVVAARRIGFGVEQAVDLDDEWADAISSCIAGLPSVDSVVVAGDSRAPAYLLDTLEAAHDSGDAVGDPLVPVCVVGFFTDAGPYAEPGEEGGFMETASAVFEAVPGGLVVSGRQAAFAATVMVPVDADIDVAREVIESTADELGVSLEVVSLGRVDSDAAATHFAGDGPRLNTIDAVGAVFFTAHGMDPARFATLAVDETCAFPDVDGGCERGFWTCAHRQYHEGTLGVPLRTAADDSGLAPTKND